MAQKRIGDYLESGSLGLFVEQIVEALEGAFAVAIHDADGKLVWVGPNESDSSRCTVNPFVQERDSGPGFCEQLDGQNLAYVFYLDCEQSGDLMGTLSVLVESAQPASFEFAYRELKPILTCIERQVEINAELSSVRRMSSEGRDGLELLGIVDEGKLAARPPSANKLGLVVDHRTIARFALTQRFVDYPEFFCTLAHSVFKLIPRTPHGLFGQPLLRNVLDRTTHPNHRSVVGHNRVVIVLENALLTRDRRSFGFDRSGDHRLAGFQHVSKLRYGPRRDVG